MSAPHGLTLRGVCGIGIEHPKYAVNVGSLLRSACVLGADFAFIIGMPRDGRSIETADTTKAARHMPFYRFGSLDELALPMGADLIGVEMDAEPIGSFDHPDRAVYLLGAEDHGLSDAALEICDRVVTLPGEISLNVSVAGAIVLHDRAQQLAAANKEG